MLKAHEEVISRRHSRAGNSGIRSSNGLPTPTVEGKDATAKAATAEDKLPAGELALRMGALGTAMS